MSNYADPNQIADAIESLEWKGCSIGHKVILANAVAALRATQPAAGEPVAWECYEPASELNGYKGRDYLSREKPKGCSVRAVPLGRIAAPPAAAHGDEAVRKLSWAEEHEAFKQWARSRITPLKLDLDEVGLFYDEVAGVAHDAWHARAAMRAHGDGEKSDG